MLLLLAGGLVYATLRERTLRLFAWAEAIGLAAPVDRLRDATAAWRSDSGGWPLFSLPDGLWLLSLLLVVDAVWLPQPAMSAWLRALLVAGAVGHEMAQGLGVVQGTFAWPDIACYAAAAALSAAASPGSSDSGRRQVQQTFSVEVL